MNVEIGAEAALFPEKEYINGIAVAVQTIASGVIRQGRRLRPSITHHTYKITPLWAASQPGRRVGPAL
jgi:hypothetical protein